MGKPFLPAAGKATRQIVVADADIVTNTVSPTTGGVADSRNAVLMGALETTKTLLSGGGTATATFQSVYSQMVSAVGNKAREVKVNRDAQDSLLTQATSAQQSVSGVNLDEEAANLVRYQQAYQASAKMIQIAQNIFDSLIQGLGR